MIEAGDRVRRSWVIAGTTYTITDVRDAAGTTIARQHSDGDHVGSSADRWTYDPAGRLLSIPGHVTSFLYIPNAPAFGRTPAARS